VEARIAFPHGAAKSAGSVAIQEFSRKAAKLQLKLGDEIHFDPSLAGTKRAGFANVFQILFAKAIIASFSKADVKASTAFESLPPTENPSLLIHIVLPNSQKSDDSYEMIARCLAQAAAILNSELSK
jgi:hypothetical protein